METLTKSLVVGSANFGAKYGARSSQVSQQDSFKIIQEVSQRNDVFIESSESYPGAEKIIGEALGTKKFENSRFIVTIKLSLKLPVHIYMFRMLASRSLKTEGTLTMVEYNPSPNGLDLAATGNDALVSESSTKVTAMGEPATLMDPDVTATE